MSVMIVTSLGDMVVDLFSDRCPLTCKNFILYDPFDDPSQLADLIPDASPERKQPKDEIDDDVRLEDDWMPKDEELGVGEEKEAHSRAVILESVGDIPDAEMKPPDNVLFVCKLNPATEEGALYIIFSRFGTVTSAEIIRDHKTGDSHCYAFIKFQNKESCEQAYFKMDNTLIDNQRIRVDFSQSVAKLWSQYRPRNQRGSGRFNNGSVDAIKKQKEDNKQHGGHGNSNYSKFLRTRKETRKHKGRKHRQITKPR